MHPSHPYAHTPLAGEHEHRTADPQTDTMPLLFPESAQSPQAILDRAKTATADKPHFLVFFASIDEQTGKPWCPGELLCSPSPAASPSPELAAADRAPLLA